jgi:predicted nucleic acid-binding protein
MPNLALYDTRFFIEHYYSARDETQRKTKLELVTNKSKAVSVISLHEIYRLTLNKEGRETARLRVILISKDFRVVDVTAPIALRAAEIRHGLAIPMADSLIAATSIILNGVCVTDDPHFEKIDGLSRRWI